MSNPPIEPIRDATIRDALEQIENLTEAVNRLSQETSQLVPRDEFEQRRHQTKLTIIAVGALLVAMGAWELRSDHRADQSRKETRRGIACLVAMMESHRQNNRAWHEEVLNSLGKPLMSPIPEPPPLQGDEITDLADLCGPFVERAQGLGLPTPPSTEAATKEKP